MQLSGREAALRFLGFMVVALLIVVPIPVKQIASAQDVVIVLDPGHGGQDPGITGKGGTIEKEVCLDLAQKVKARIDKQLGYRTFLTRAQDETLSLKERASLANNHRGTLYVSIHLAGFTDQLLQGLGIFTLNVAPSEGPWSGEEGKVIPVWDAQQVSHIKESRHLAEILHDRFREQFPSQRDFGVRRLPIYPFSGIDMPAVLIEPVVLTSPVEENKLQAERFREEVAEVIFQGIRDFVQGAPLGGHDE